MQSQLKVVVLLLRAGAEVSAEDMDGNTPLHEATRAGNNPQVIKELLDAGASCTVPGLLHNVVRNSHFIRKSAKAEVINLLLQAGADPNGRCPKYRGTALHLAITTGTSSKLYYAEALMEQGDMNATDSAGYTPLDLAVSKGRHWAIDALIKHGANINHTTSAGFTPLLTAAMQGEARIVNALVKAGANVTAKLRDGRTALQLLTQQIGIQREVLDTLCRARAGLADGMDKEINNLRAQLADTQEQKAALERELSVNQKTLEAEKAKWQTELNCANQAHQQTLQAEKAKHQNQLDSLAQAHHQVVNAERAAHHAAQESLAQKHEVKLKKEQENAALEARKAAAIGQQKLRAAQEDIFKGKQELELLRAEREKEHHEVKAALALAAKHERAKIEAGRQLHQQALEAERAAHHATQESAAAHVQQLTAALEDASRLKEEVVRLRAEREEERRTTQKMLQAAQEEVSRGKEELGLHRAEQEKEQQESRAALAATAEQVQAKTEANRELQEELEALRVKLHEEMRAKECTVCMESDIDTFFVPCGHAAACARCKDVIDRFKKCPVCRQEIAQTVTVFGMSSTNAS